MCGPVQAAALTACVALVVAIIVVVFVAQPPPPLHSSLEPHERARARFAAQRTVAESLGASEALPHMLPSDSPLIATLAAASPTALVETSLRSQPRFPINAEGRSTVLKSSTDTRAYRGLPPLPPMRAQRGVLQPY